MEKNKLSLFKKNKENPFIKQAIDTIENNIVKRYKTASNTDEKAILQAFDQTTGELLGHTRFIRQIEIDEEKFAKFYLSNFSSFFDLKPSAIKVFGYILEQLTPNKDDFYFEIEDSLNFTKYKQKKSIYEGLAALLYNDIIARGRNEYHYFINPMVVFNGNRITFAKTYVKKKKKTVDPNQTVLNFKEVKPISAKEAFENKSSTI